MKEYFLSEQLRLSGRMSASIPLLPARRPDFGAFVRLMVESRPGEVWAGLSSFSRTGRRVGWLRTIPSAKLFSVTLSGLWLFFFLLSTA